MLDSTLQQDLCRRIRQQFERLGIVDRAQSVELARVLELSHSQAYRKLSGSTPLTLMELERLVRHFKVSYAALLGEKSEGAPPVAEAAGLPLLPAMAQWGGPQPCRIRLGQELDDTLVSPVLAARQIEGQWWVTTTGGEPVPAGSFAVEHLSLDPTPPARRPPRFRVAVLDDENPDITAELLQLQGLDCVPFTSGNALLAALRGTSFDIVVLDWVLGQEDGASVLSALRAQVPDGLPVLLLTGHAKEHERTLAEALQLDKVYYVAKPVVGAVLAAQIRNALKS